MPSSRLILASNSPLAGVETDGTSSYPVRRVLIFSPPWSATAAGAARANARAAAMGRMVAFPLVEEEIERGDKSPRSARVLLPNHRTAARRAYSSPQNKRALRRAPAVTTVSEA